MAPAEPIVPGDAPFRYDGSGVDRVYDLGRDLDGNARDVWSRAIREHLGQEPVRRVLDLGCGTGRFAGLLGGILSASVCGVDPSGDMLGRAAAKPGLASVRLVRGAAEAIPLRTGTIDAVFVYLAYHHFSDRRAALAECARVLRPRGRLMLSTPTRETLPSFIWLPFFPTAERIDRQRMPTRAELADTALSAPLELEGKVTVRRTFAQSLVEYAERVGLRTFSTLRLVPDAEFEKGMRALRAFAAARDQAGAVVAEEIDVFVLRARGA